MSRKSKARLRVEWHKELKLKPTNDVVRLIKDAFSGNNKRRKPKGQR